MRGTLVAYLQLNLIVLTCRLNVRQQLPNELAPLQENLAQVSVPHAEDVVLSGQSASADLLWRKEIEKPSILRPTALLRLGHLS